MLIFSSFSLSTAKISDGEDLCISVQAYTYRMCG
jgi:hypothetical protein